MRCRIPVAELNGGVWNLADGDKVHVQVRAKTCEEGEASKGNPVTLKAAPPAVATPESDGCTEGSTFTVTWAAADGSSGNAYELYWDAGTGHWQDRPLMAKSNSTTYTVRKVRGRCAYRFKVRACTACGLGTFSPELRVECGAELKAPKCAAFSPDGCNIKVKWLPAETTCTRVTKYTVEVGCDADFREWPRCSGLRQECTIPMAKLADFGFQSGSKVSVKVYAHTADKTSEAAEPGEGGATITMISTPPRMSAPRATLLNNNSTIRVCW
jgi:rRNA maturation protein Nop10